MSFISIYRNIVKQEFPYWDLPDRSKEHFTAIYELGEAIDAIIPQQIHLQEKAVNIGTLIINEIKSKPTLSNGEITPILMNDISSALESEVLVKWTTPWSTLKMTAAAIYPTPPQFLSWSSSPPSGTGTDFPDGSEITSYFQSVKKNYAGPEGYLDDIMVLARALAEFVKQEYPKHGQASPPPSYPAI